MTAAVASELAPAAPTTATSESVFAALDPSAPGFNMAALLERWAELQPDTVAVAVGRGAGSDGSPRFDERTFGELNAMADRYARALSKAGLKAGDRAVLFVIDPIEFFALVFACCKLQVVFVLIDPGMGVKPLLKCVEEQQPKAILGIAKAHVLRTVFAGAFKSATLRVLVGSSFFPGAKALSKMVDALPASERDAPFPREALDPNVPAAIFYTSGSTGIPKGVVFTHAMMGGQAKAIRDLFDFEPGEPHVACFPLFALIAGSIGMSAVVPEMNLAKPADTDPEKVVEAFRRYGARSGFGSPALWEPFSRYVEERHDNGAPIELEEVTRLLTAGAPVSPALHQRLLRALPNGDVFTPYGATEALPIAFIGGREVLAKTAARTSEGKGTCVGAPVPGVCVRVIRVTDDVIERFSSDLEVPRGEIGEIIVKGPLISRVYDKRPQHTALSKIEDEDGFFHRMGDVGYLDDEGRLWFCGRKSHRVVTSEGTLYSVPCEAVCETHSKVARAALTWVGERPQQTPVMCVELEEGVVETAALVEEVKVLLAGNAITKGISHVRVHPKFPVDRRHNAKIEREKLSVWAASQLGR